MTLAPPPPKAKQDIIIERGTKVDYRVSTLSLAASFFGAIIFFSFLFFLSTELPNALKLCDRVRQDHPTEALRIDQEESD